MTNKNINQKELTKISLLSAFPSVSSLENFFDDNNDEIIQSILTYAFERKIIIKPEKKLLCSFVDEKCPIILEAEIPDDIHLNALKEDANIQSTRWLTKEMNRMIEKLDLSLSKVSNTMFTRLGNEAPDTPVKRNTLRLLAIWLGLNRPELALSWNYDTLFKISPLKHNYKSDKGVRIAFSLHSRGDVINEKTIKWFKKELNDCINDLNIKYAKIRGTQSFNITEFSIDLPQKDNITEDFIHPMSYNTCVRDSIAIAHQMKVRWSLSPYNSNKKFLTIGIATGEFVHLDIYLQTIINLEIYRNPAICVTDFTHQCLLLNDIKVIFNDNSDDIKIATGEIVKLWWIDSIWSHIYWDYIPSLLSDRLLPCTMESYFKFTEYLYFSTEKSNTESNPLSGILQIHQNPTLMIELAKVCLYRKMFYEANHIISVVLASNTNHIVARCIRMQIYLNLALVQNRFSQSELFFKKAIREGLFVTKNCKITDEEPWCEFGLVYFGLAFKILKTLRSKEHKSVLSGGHNKDSIIPFLRKAEDCFEEGSSISPVGLPVRSDYWLLQTRSFCRLLENDHDLMISNKPFRDVNNIYDDEGKKYFIYSGWIDGIHDENFTYKKVISIFNIYETAVVSRSYIPTIRLGFATMIFDFYPNLTTGMVKTVLNYLDEACTLAEKLKKYNLGIYSVANCFAQIQSAETFIRLIEKTKAEIQQILKEDLKKQDDYVIDKKKLNGFKLILSNIDEDIEQGILVEK